MSIAVLLHLLCAAAPALPVPGPLAGDPGRPLQVHVYLQEDVRPIPPLSYGANEGGIEEIPFRRHGGNRFSAFDWETSASNAGSDWLHQNDDYLAPREELRGPGLLLAGRVQEDRRRGARSLVTLQLAGYVAADSAGPVGEDEVAPGPRWKRVVLEASEPRAGGPDMEDGLVYLDEQVRDLVARFGRAEEGGVLAYALDNEPALWATTHARMHEERALYDEVVDKGVAAARLVTAEDGSAQVFGPVLYGWAAFVDLQGAPDAGRHRRRHPTFVDHYLAAMADASEEAGRRLLHRLDVHWYPEAMGDERIVGRGVTPATCAARVAAPRSLWDENYRERSWIVDVIDEPIALLPRLEKSVERFFPGTGLAVTEYNFGAAHHVSGGLAQADALGIFGRRGVAACWWDLGGETDYVQAAFRLYLDYDGAGGRFGDLSVRARSDDEGLVSVHAATSSADSELLTVLVLHKDFATPRSVDVQLHGDGRRVTVVDAWRFDGHSAELRAVAEPATLGPGGFSARLPPASATLFVVRLSAGDAAPGS